MPVFAAYTLVFVKNMERAVAFYREALGLALRFKTASWSELDCAGAIIALHAGREGPERDTQLGFKVLNIDAVANAIVAQGGAIEAPKRRAPGEPVILKAMDTEGNSFFLSEGPA